MKVVMGAWVGSTERLDEYAEKKCYSKVYAA